jgi:putative FmdB family regulatory protein
MPTYEYRCLKCGRRFEIFLTYEEYGKQTVVCSHCQSENVQRRIGRIRVARSEESRLGRMMRQMSSELGEDMGPEFDEVINRLESGQSPDEIEASMPDLGESGGAPGGEDF